MNSTATSSIRVDFAFTFYRLTPCISIVMESPRKRRDPAIEIIFIISICYNIAVLKGGNLMH